MNIPRKNRNNNPERQNACKKSTASVLSCCFAESNSGTGLAENSRQNCGKAELTMQNKKIYPAAGSLILAAMLSMTACGNANDGKISETTTAATTPALTSSQTAASEKTDGVDVGGAVSEAGDTVGEIVTGGADIIDDAVTGAGNIADELIPDGSARKDDKDEEMKKDDKKD